MKLLRSERPGISFFAKVVQLLALKCGTGLMFPEKKVVFVAQSGLKHCRWRVETNTKRSGSRFRGRGRDVAKKQINNESNNWESDHSTYFALRSLYLNIWSCLNSELHRLQVKRCYFCSQYSRRKSRPFLFSLFSLILVVNH